MRITYHLKRMQDALSSLSLAKKLNTHDQWTTEDIKVYQDQRLRSLVKHAVKHSPFYRDFYAHINPDKHYDYEDLPVLDKKTMMENYDRFVTDPRLNLHDIEDHIKHLTRDTYYLDQYRVLSTGGSTGLSGVFAFNRNEWRTILTAHQRMARYMGSGLRLPNRLKVANVMAYHPRHISSRIPESIDLGLVVYLRMNASDSLESMVEALNEFQPETLGLYPSSGALLATEQLEGRLKISPRIVGVGGEVCTDEMKHLMHTAWGKNFFNFYGSTELYTLGVNCSHNKGIHIFDDLMILEVVDENNQPVPDGVLGNKILVTNLHYYTQPLIRYEISDMVKISTTPCSCGVPFRLLESIEGRCDDILELEGLGPKPVSIHPIAFRTALGKMHDLRQYQVVHKKDGLHLNLVPRDSNGKEKLRRNVESVITNILESQHVKHLPMRIHFVDQIERDQNHVGKLKLIKKEVA